MAEAISAGHPNRPKLFRIHIEHLRPACFLCHILFREQSVTAEFGYASIPARTVVDCCTLRPQPR